MSTNRARQSRQPRKPRPLPGSTLLTPDASSRRQAIEQRSATTLLWLHQLPVWLLPLLAIALLITGFAVSGLAGGVALVGLALVLCWLAAISWPRLNAQARLIRVAAIAVVLIAAALRAFG